MIAIVNWIYKVQQIFKVRLLQLLLLMNQTLLLIQDLPAKYEHTRPKAHKLYAPRVKAWPIWKSANNKAMSKNVYLMLLFDFQQF